jgi:two-component system, cell cycle response regulator
MDTSRQAIDDALADLIAGRIETTEQLHTSVNLLELAPYRDAAAVAAPARVAADLAAKRGDEQLQARVRLIQADLLAREGRVTESGQLLFATSEWADDNGSAHVQARSHYLLSTFYRLMGDIPTALEHAMLALKRTPRDVLPELRAEHLLLVALAFDESGNAEEAAWRYEEVVSLGLRIGHPRLSINGLNHMANVCCKEDRLYDAVSLVSRMTKIADEYGLPLTAAHLETAAKVEVLLGSPDIALGMLEPVLAPRPGEPPPEPEALAQCLLTGAEAQRALGMLPQAQETLARLQKLCRQTELRTMQVLARQEQAQLYAETGDYRRAYEEHRAFHAACEELRSSEHEARARILQVTLGAQEARENSKHFEELAMRDPLTGLHNRRFVNDYLADQLDRCAAHGQPLSIAMLDLDHFKRINDTLSHKAGDAVLVAFAAVLCEAAAEPLQVARLGGEEFLVILPRTSHAEAEDWTRGMLDAIRRHDWAPLTGQLPVTASVGLTTVTGLGCSRELLLSAADENLYAAKRGGRDRFVGSIWLPPLALLIAGDA